MKYQIYNIKVVIIEGYAFLPTNMIETLKATTLSFNTRQAEVLLDGCGVDVTIPTTIVN